MHDDDQPQRRKRPPPPLSPAYLRGCAEQHLQRFWPSVSQLRRVLLRRVDRCLEHHGGDRAQGEAMVEALLADLLAVGLLDDRRYTRAWVEDLHRRGLPRRAIQARMATKGVAGALVSEALDALDQREADAELARACAYVRRRRLGPARPEHKWPTDPDARRKRREKDLAAVCRAGFGFGLARRVIDAADLDLLEAEAAGG